MFDFFEDLKVKVVGLVVTILVAVIWFAGFGSGGSSSSTSPETSSSPSSSVPERDTDGRIAKAKGVLEQIKAERGKDGAPGELSVLDLNKPEVVLPAVLALLDSELGYYGIDNGKLSEEVKANPDAFRKEVPERLHLRKRFLLLKPEHEKLAGDKIDAELAASGKVYQDEKAQARVQSIIDKLAPQMPEALPLKVFLYNDDTMNAFCLPNGSVYVHSGLLARIKDDGVLAFVLAHELAHVAAKHGNEGITKRILLMAGEVLAENKADKLIQGGKIGSGILLKAGYIGGGLVAFELPFSRLMETEADILGIRYMARAGYAPEGAVKALEAIGDVDAEDPGLAKYLSTHPVGKDRHELMMKECAKIKSGTSGRKTKLVGKTLDWLSKRKRKGDKPEPGQQPAEQNTPAPEPVQQPAEQNTPARESVQQPAEQNTPAPEPVLNP